MAMDLQNSLANCDIPFGHLYRVTYVDANKRPTAAVIKSYSDDILSVDRPRPHDCGRIWIVHFSCNIYAVEAEFHLLGLPFAEIERLNMVKRESDLWTPEEVYPYGIVIRGLPYDMDEDGIAEQFVGYTQLIIERMRTTLMFDSVDETLVAFRTAFDWRPGDCSLSVRFRRLGVCTVFILFLTFFFLFESLNSAHTHVSNLKEGVRCKILKNH